MKGDPTKERYDGNLPVQTLEECASVEEVIAMFHRYNHEGTWNGQYYFADKTGAAVIIEGGVMHRKQGRFQVATNFYLSQAAAGMYPCWRFNRASKMLKKDEPVTVDLCRRVLTAVKQKGATPTVYSNIFDLKKGIAYLYHFHNCDDVVIPNLHAELRKGYHTTTFASLFPSAPAIHVRGSSMKPPISQLLMPVIERDGVTAAFRKFKALSESEKSHYDCQAMVLNVFGMELGYAGRLEAAIEWFESIIEEDPRNERAYAGLAWAYEKNGQVEQAILNYEASLRLDPKNTNTAKRLRELRNQ